MPLRYRNAINQILATLFVISAAAFAAFGQGWSQNVSPLPPPTGHVNDYADVIDQANRQGLETKLRGFKEKTGVEIAVAVVRTTGDRDIFDYSLAVARGWGIGAKTDDNPGALLFIAIDDRKYFTQISKDLEDELPDGVAGSLQRQYLVPEFKKGDYAKGISDTVDAYISTIEQRTSGFIPPESTATRDHDSVDGISVFFVLVIALIVVLTIVSNIRRHDKSKDDEDRWGGGGSGGGGLMDAIPWIIVGGSGSSSSDSSSSWSDWGSSGGSDWGGFGGGGDFGGGGAGGGW